MRVIKFRGKDKYTGKWVFGDLAHSKGISTNGLYDRVMVGGYHVIEETVGQFTGLLDKNGKEIYEGDIILESTDGINTDWNIRYDIGLSQYRAENIGDECDDIQLNAVWLDRSEIIGSIHDNPELLKGGDE